jgi:hypothetical protein
LEEELYLSKTRFEKKLYSEKQPITIKAKNKRLLGNNLPRWMQILPTKSTFLV